MLLPKNDSNNYGANDNDENIDLGAKGGPGSGLGNPDANHRISRPYGDDLQAQIAAKGKNKKKNKEVKEKQK
jgi:hypothetical protein